MTESERTPRACASYHFPAQSETKNSEVLVIGVDPEGVTESPIDSPPVVATTNGLRSSKALARVFPHADFSHVRESPINVGDDVFHIFDSHRDPHHAIGDAHFFADLRRHGRVCHEGGMRNERLNSAETFRQRA